MQSEPGLGAAVQTPAERPSLSAPRPPASERGALLSPGRDRPDPPPNYGAAEPAADMHRPGESYRGAATPAGRARGLSALSAGQLSALDESSSSESSRDSFEFHGGADAGSSHAAVIHLEDEDLHIWAYRRCLWKTVLTYLLCVLTAGLARLVMYWYPQLYVICTASKSTMAACDHMLVK